ncbi:hypothetical protein Tco_0164464, partial [Tanacetum coccineum]
VHAKIDVFKKKITLRVGEEKIIFKSAKPASSVIKRVYMLGLRERMELDLEARLMGETLVLNRSLNPFFGDYIELNDLNVPLELKRYQIDDLIPTIEEGEVIEEFRSRNDARMVSKVFGYPSDCDHDKQIRMDCAYNLKFSCMIDFVVLEDMDAYRDEGTGDKLLTKWLRSPSEVYTPPLMNNANKIMPLLKDSNMSEMQRWKNSSTAGHIKDLAAKKLTMLVKYLQSGNQEVLES